MIDISVQFVKLWVLIPMSFCHFWTATVCAKCVTREHETIFNFFLKFTLRADSSNIIVQLVLNSSLSGVEIIRSLMYTRKMPQRLELTVIDSLDRYKSNPGNMREYWNELKRRFENYSSVVKFNQFSKKYFRIRLSIKNNSIFFD